MVSPVSSQQSVASLPKTSGTVAGVSSAVSAPVVKAGGNAFGGEAVRSPSGLGFLAQLRDFFSGLLSGFVDLIRGFVSPLASLFGGGLGGLLGPLRGLLGF
jgi:hypothetical protein